MAKIPKFKTLKDEIKFWETHCLSDYLDDTEEVDLKITDSRNKKKRTTIYLDIQEHEKIRKLSFIKKTSMNEFIREAIHDKIRHILSDSAKDKKRKAS